MAFSAQLTKPVPIWTIWGPFKTPELIKESRWYTLVNFPRIDPHILTQAPDISPWKWGGRHMHCVHPVPTVFFQHLDLEELQYLELILTENLAAIRQDDALMGRRVDETLVRIGMALKDRGVQSYKAWKARDTSGRYNYLLTGKAGRDGTDVLSPGKMWWNEGLWRALRPVYTFGATTTPLQAFERKVDLERENMGWI